MFQLSEENVHRQKVVAGRNTRQNTRKTDGTYSAIIVRNASRRPASYDADLTFKQAYAPCIRRLCYRRDVLLQREQFFVRKLAPEVQCSVRQLDRAAADQQYVPLGGRIFATATVGL